MNYTTNAAELMNMDEGAGYVIDATSLYGYLMTLTDGRKARGKRYPLAAILLITVLAKLAGEDQPLGIAEWARLRTGWLVEALNLKHQTMPCHTTYSRILGQAVDIAEFEEVAGTYLNQTDGQAVLIAIDGKTLRGTITRHNPNGVHLLAAYMPERGVVLLQVEVDGKENEIVAAPRLLAGVDVQGRVVTGDAMFAQRKLSAQVVEAGGDYLWTVKDNQPKLRAAIEKLFTPEYCLPGHSPMQHDFATTTQVNKSHGRVEKRTIITSSMLQKYAGWPYLQQVFKIDREVTHLANGKQTHEIAYGITSLSAQEAPPERLLLLNRMHWHIENRLHYSRDVTFLEDRCRLSVGHAARSMAIINNLVLGLIRKQGFDYAPQARRFYNAHQSKALNLLLAPYS